MALVVISATFALTGAFSAVAVAAPPENRGADGVLFAAEATPAAVPGWPPFPAVYGPRYWPDAGVVMEQNTVLTTAQTRTLYETGLVPAYGSSGLPYAGIARWLHTSGELKRAAQMGGCVILGIRDNAVWSPKLKKNVRWVGRTYYSLPTTSPVNRAIINRICSS